MSGAVDTRTASVEALAAHITRGPHDAWEIVCASTLRALAAERDALRAHQADLLAENDAARFRLNNVTLDIAAARRAGMEEAAKVADASAHHYRTEVPAQYAHREGGIPHDWRAAWENSAETADEIAAAIRAAAKGGGDV